MRSVWSQRPWMSRSWSRCLEDQSERQQLALVAWIGDGTRFLCLLLLLFQENAHLLAENCLSRLARWFDGHGLSFWGTFRVADEWSRPVHLLLYSHRWSHFVCISLRKKTSNVHFLFSWTNSISDCAAVSPFYTSGSQFLCWVNLPKKKKTQIEKLSKDFWKH